MSPTLDRRRALVSLAGIGAAGIATTRTATAQGTPAVESAEADGTVLVVSATGSASVPASHAIAQVVIRANYGAEPVQDPSGTPGAAPPVVTDEDMQAVVDALFAQGVDQAQILTNVAPGGVGGGAFGPGTAAVVFQVNGEQIKTLGKTLEVAVKTVAERGLIFDQPGAMYLADTCQDLRAEAYQDAVAEGMAEATLLADATGVSLAGLRQAKKQSISYGPAAFGYGQSDSCADLMDLGTAARTYLPAYDATLPNEFIVYAAVELAFATI
jgi:uncharacterized protein YggE